MSGIRTHEDIRQRCFVDESTGCWHWRGAMCSGQPSMWVPALGQTCRLGTVLSIFAGLPRNQVFWRRTCSSADCVSPKHRVQATRSEIFVASGSYRKTPQWRAKLRGRLRLSDEAVEAIRNSDEPQPVLAARYGCTPSHVSLLQLGKRRPARTGCAAMARALGA